MQTQHPIILSLIRNLKTQMKLPIDLDQTITKSTTTRSPNLNYKIPKYTLTKCK